MFRSKWTDARQKKGGLDLRGSITDQVLRYSCNPNPGSTTPNAAPRDGNGKSVTLDTDVDAPSFDRDLLGTLELDPVDQQSRVSRFLVVQKSSATQARLL